MKANPNAKTVFTTDFNYDLLDGGYISPAKLLIEGGEEVEAAVRLINDFLQFAEAQGLIELS